MEKPTAIIIGAGLAGLTTAMDLHNAGWRTTILEARHRVGGRVFTLHDSFQDAQYAEGGGEFIDGIHQRMLDLTRQFNLQLEKLGGMGDWTRRLAFAGRIGRPDDAALWGADLLIELDKIWKALADLGHLVPDPSNPQMAPDADQLDQQTVAHWLDTLDVHPLAKQVFAVRVRSEYLAEPKNFSLLDLARWGAFYYNDPEEDNPVFRIVGGNDQLPKAMANTLPDVRLGARVTAIQQKNGRVGITYRAFNKAAHIEGDFAVLAIPLGPARQIAMTPPLPPEHQAMLEGVTYGPVTKVLIQYRGRFWGDDDWNGSLITDLPIGLTWEPTHLQGGAGSILTVYTGADRGIAFSALSDEDRIANAIAQLDLVFPGSAQQVIAARTTAWTNDPYTQGGYVAFAPGEVTAHWNTLHQPVERLYFAGEHTAVHQGYMEGAVESGQRIARELLSQVGA